MSLCIYVLVVLLASVLLCVMLVQCWSCLAVLFCYIYYNNSNNDCKYVSVSSITYCLDVLNIDFVCLFLVNNSFACRIVVAIIHALSNHYT